MRSKIKLWYNKNITWIYNLQYIFISIICIAIVARVDIGYEDRSSLIPMFFLMRSTLATTVLTTLAGALLTITTFAFSTILAVMTMYASSYTPRVVENFIKNKITMKVLGIFIGGFFYCVAAILLIKNLPNDSYVIAGSIAIFYSMACIVYFVIFVQEVIYSIQGINLVSDVFDIGLPNVEKEVHLRESDNDYKVNENFKDFIVSANASGYLSLVDLESIEKILSGYECLLTVESRIGEFVVKGFPVAKLEISGEQMDDDAQKDMLEKLSNVFLFQEGKVEQDNYRFGITKLVEIALRALSPGINDPNTANHCIRKLSILLGRLSSTDYYNILKKDHESIKVIYTSYNLGEDLYHSYYQICYYGREDAVVIYTLMESLYNIFVMCSQGNKRYVREFAEHVFQMAKKSIKDDMGMEKIEKNYRRIKDDQSCGVDQETLQGE